MTAELVAGRELDALVAEKVMGLVPGKDFGTWPKHVWQLDDDGEVDNFAYDGDKHNGPRCTLCDYSYCHHCEGPNDTCDKPPPGYSTYLLWAWRVVERLQLAVIPDAAGGWRAAPDPFEGPHWYERNVNEWEWGETAPVAICRAALAASGPEPGAAGS